MWTKRFTQLIAILLLSSILSGCVVTDLWQQYFGKAETPTEVPIETLTPDNLPVDFVEYQAANLGISFSYPKEYGTVKTENPLPKEPGLTALNFALSSETNTNPKATDNTSATITPKLKPSATLIDSNVDMAKSTVKIGFNAGPAADCDQLKADNTKITKNYLASTSAKPELKNLLTLNPFHCEIRTINNLTALISINPLKIIPADGKETKVDTPIPIPVIEFRFVPGKNFRTQAAIFSLVAFGDEKGTSYQDYLNNTLDGERLNAINNFWLMLDSLKFTASDANLIDQVLEETTETDTQSTGSDGKRRRPQATSNQTILSREGFLPYNDFDLIKFSYPADWLVKKQTAKVLTIASSSTNAANQIPELRIKLLDNPSQQKLTDFIKSGSQVLLTGDAEPESISVQNINFLVFRNFNGIKKLNVYFALIGDKVLEIDTLAESETAFAAEILSVVQSVRLK